ncbi:MgtC/SapB family protein [Mesorhizobium sp. CAU 1732]|uniref:MgtC/SapB family protein n=1 Tax=Mesorhizobium sp. CAU 1732 TaxID=3140358 RepID=UPI0032609588
MQEILDDIGHPTWLPFSVIAARLAIAALLGAVIGFEREWRNHPAGLRTHILVALAAAAFAILGIEIVHSAQFDADASRLDPLRLIEAVTAGVAFLAAGTIIFARGEIKGLTTGAGLWLAGAIGLAAGLGFWQIAGYATLLAIVILGLMHPLEKAVTAHKARDEAQKDDDAPTGR